MSTSTVLVSNDRLLFRLNDLQIRPRVGSSADPMRTSLTPNVLDGNTTLGSVQEFASSNSTVHEITNADDRSVVGNELKEESESVELDVSFCTIIDVLLSAVIEGASIS